MSDRSFDIAAFLRGLFTEHLLAKFFAILFAVLVVVLVDRELRSDWISGERLAVVVSGQEGANTTGKHRIVLTPDSGVAIDTRMLADLELDVSGVDREKDRFMRELDIRLPVRLEWTDPDSAGWREHVIDENDFELPDGVELVLRGAAERRTIRVERFDEVEDVMVKVVVHRSTEIGPEVTWTPEAVERTVTIRGPRAELSEMGVYRGNVVELEVVVTEAPARGPNEFQARLPDKYLESGVRMDPPEIPVVVNVRGNQLATVELDQLVIKVELERRHLDEIQDGRIKLTVYENLTTQTKVTLEGSPSVIREYRRNEDKRRELTEGITLTVRPGPEIDALDVPERGVDLDVFHWGVPRGLRVRKIDPPRVSVSIKRIDNRKKSGS